ncbi:MAG: NAD(P)/FAD-dependent oxidoreductase [Lachnospiraceae bacterium]|nr:NAD(P)/FAD-dependent oxidoreductase [Lachnospiraceae bacterium]
MKIIVAGGGAAGMMAAVTAAEAGQEVLLLEKNEKLGKKLFITGKGRCNFTNACETSELFEHVISNPKFLYSAIYGFDNNCVMDYFASHGLPYKVERGNRVFPRSDHSSDVIKTLSEHLKRLGVKIRLNCRVLHVNVSGDRVTGVTTDQGEYSCDAVILALGGPSYPGCGAVDDGWKIMRELQINVTDPFPSLVPFEVAETDIPDLQGLSMKNVRLSVTVDGKTVFEEFGELLFTHFGLSGPLILSASCYLSKADYQKKPLVSIDLKPALDEKTLDERILRDFASVQNKQFKNALSGLLPSKMIPVIIKRSEIPADKPVHEITREERKRLLYLLKHFTCTVNGNRGLPEAIITRGGVSVKEIDPATMAVKKYKGLYVAGEMIDVDAQTGGYNLQIAWSTGHLSGSSVGID